jgi:leader peptidase (prepilin peptidase) / N-methyltransferase
MPFYSDGMLVAMWIVLLFALLFLLGSTVGSFLNVCIVRLPQGRSLIRPASCCGQCGKPIRWQDNIPLLSYWLLRGRCRACGAAFSKRYFWIELLTGLVFVLIYYLEIASNIHHFRILSGYENDYEYLLMKMFWPRPWLVFAVHAVLSCFLIVTTMTSHEQHHVPRSVTVWGILLGLVTAVLFPWPWPDEVIQAIVPSAGSGIIFGREEKPYSWGPHLGAMPGDSPWWQGDVTPRAGLYPWPVWGPLPDWMPAGSHQLGLATGVAGVLMAAILMGSVRLAFNFGAGGAVIGWGETSLLMIAGGFLGWQPVLVVGVLGLVPGILAATVQWTARRRQPVGFGVWITLAVAAVELGWYWIGPLVQEWLFQPTRLLLLLAVWAAFLLVLCAGLSLTRIARPVLRSSMNPGDSMHQPSRELP